MPDAETVSLLSTRNPKYLEEHARILEKIALGHPLAEVLEAIVLLLETLHPASLGSILLYDPARNTLQHGAAPSLPASFCRAIDGSEIGPAVGSCGTAAYRREPVIVSDIAVDPLWKDYREIALQQGLHACWSAPILSRNGDVLGTFAIYHKAPHTPSKQEREALVGMSHLASIALERHRMDTALQLSEERLRLAVSGAGIGTWHYNGVTHEMVWSQHLVKLFGLSETPQDRDVWLESIHPDDRNRVDRVITDAAEQGADFEVEYRVILPDGAPRWLVTRGKGYLDESGRPLHMEGIALDIDTLKGLQVQSLQAQKMEGLGRLAGGIAHDFNNLLSIILGYAEMVELELTQESDLLRNVHNIQTAATRAAKLTAQLLAFARRQMIEPQVISPVRLLTAMEELFHPMLGDRIERIFIASEPVGYVNIDPNQLEQAIINLVVNACDAMPQGGRLTILCENVEIDQKRQARGAPVEPGPYVRIAVTDTGAGISDAIQERIFEPFFSTKGVGKGSGLGLATCYGIVKQNNGYLCVESAPGQGATFEVYLPRVACPEEASLQDMSSEGSTDEESKEESKDEKRVGTKTPRADEQSGLKTLLVVEDEPLVRALVTHALSLQGYQVLEAGNGVEALQVVQAHNRPIDLLITDAAMPQMGGIELIGRLRQFYPGLKALLLSGYAREVFEEDAPLPSGTLFLQKPLSSRVLLTQIREQLG